MPPQSAAQTGPAIPTAMAFLLDADSEGVARRSFSDVGFIDGQVVRGGIDAAVDELSRRGSPKFLILDISGVSEPLPRISRLAEVCDPGTEVIVVGERNDIVLYRDLKSAGVAEYFYKPLIGNVLSRTLVDISSGTRTQQQTRSGRLVIVLGVRGGVGATTVATNLAWYIAEIRQSGVLLLDLDLHGGDAALQLHATPTHALREALDDPERIDELFLERGVVSVGGRLGLLAGLEPLSDRLVPSEDAVQLLLQKLLTHFRYVLVDLSSEIAQSQPSLLHMPSTLLLVSDGSLTSIRDVGRWRELLGPNTPERTVVHVLNKQSAEGELPEEEMLRVIPAPDVKIRYDRKIMNAATLGTKSVQERAAMREGMAALSLRLSGTAAEEERSLWKRIFG
ncbi:MAG TPA: cellulose synthase operon protein YhjQ/BcsQ [Stellaceae bacterium]|nr:cellulose synthase operon protein YhjQ/BcsQ [Stellaceae bacterium]